MRLRDLIVGLRDADEEYCIVAKRPWTEESEAQLIRLTEDFQVPAHVLNDGYVYLLEVSVALEEVLGDLREVLTPAQRYSAVLFYAENDAYPDWLCELRG